MLHTVPLRPLPPDISLVEPRSRESSDVLVVAQPIRNIENGSELGTLTAAIRLRTLLPDDALSVAFGRAGYSAVLDRSENRVLYHPSRAVFQQPLSTLLGPDGWDVDEVVLSDESGNFAYEEEGTPRMASFVSLATPPWMIVAATWRASPSSCRERSACIRSP